MSEYSFPILTKEEIAAKLVSLRVGRGVRPVEGEGLNLNCVRLFMGYNEYKMSIAGVGIMNEKTQLDLSRFFHKWQSGELVFVYEKGKGWSYYYPEIPIPRNIKKDPPPTRFDIFQGKLVREE